MNDSEHSSIPFGDERTGDFLMAGVGYRHLLVVCNHNSSWVLKRRKITA
jgi:hypothetical protein